MLVWSSAGGAQTSPQTPLWGRVVNPAEVQIPFSFGRNNALIDFHEWGLGADYLSISNALSDRPQDMGQLFYRTDNFDLILGNQQLTSALPLYDTFAARGARLNFEGRDLAVAAFIGETKDPYFGGVVPSQRLFSLTAGYATSDYQAFGLAAMNYGSGAASSGGGQAVMAGYFQAGEDEQSAYSVDLRAGLDLASSSSASLSCRQAHHVQLNYARPGFSLSASSRKIGRAFGPDQGGVDLRGTLFNNVHVQWEVAPGLVLSEDYRSSEFHLDSPSHSLTSILNHSLAYQSPEFQARLGYQNLSQSTAGQEVKGTNQYAELNIPVGRYQIQPSYHSNSLGGSGYHDLGLGVLIPVSDSLTLNVRGVITHNDNSSQPITTMNAALNYNLGQRGNVTVGYSHQMGLQGQSATHRPQNSFFLSGLYRINGELSVRGSYSPYVSTVGLRYVPSANQQLQLDHRMQTVVPISPFEAGLSPQLPGQTTTLTWSTSFNGPLESGWSRERQGGASLHLSARAQPDGESIPVPDVALEIGGVQATTDKHGVATFSGLKPGTYPVQVIRPGENTNLVLPLQTEVLEVEPGWKTEKEIEGQAFSSFSLVAFNDAELTGMPDLGYIPLPGVQVQLDGAVIQTTDANGKAEFPRLNPGPHKLELVPSSLPKGMRTPPVASEFDLQAGQTQLVPLPFHGTGRVKLHVLMGGQPLANVQVKYGPHQLGVTDDLGVLEQEMPAGTHQLTMIARGQTPFYSLQDPNIKVEAGESLETILGLAHYALLRGTVCVSGQPLQNQPVQVRLQPETGEAQTCYTDDSGVFNFESLKVGRYRLELNPESLPLGMVAPEARRLNLGSGQLLLQTLELKKP